MYVDQKTWLPDDYLEKMDKATMAVGLEARVPFLDHRLIEFSSRVPSRYKVRGMQTKHLLKRIAKGILPEQILKKPKHGFAVPTDPWFRGELKDFVYEVLFDPRTKKRDYFNPKTIEKIYKAHLDGREVNDSHLWLLLNFELWHRRFMD
jgi:asparagine synthase (glutamine-hydrolysing)